VSRLTTETKSAEVLEFIHQEIPSQNITSSFKISPPPEVFNVLGSKSFCLREFFFKQTEN